MTKTLTNPQPCRECAHSVEISLVNWNNDNVALYQNGTETLIPGLFSIQCNGMTNPVLVDLFNEKTIRIDNVHPGPVIIKYLGDIDDVIHSAGYLPVPTYDAEDITLKNGTEGKGGFAKPYEAYPGAQPGFHILDGSRTGWQNFAGTPETPDTTLIYHDEYWISHAQRDSHAAGRYFHRLCYWKIQADGKIEIEALVDAHAKDKCTRHTIELIGRYSYIPALAPHETQFNFINAVNLNLLGILAGSKSFENNEDNEETGSPKNVFAELARGARPKKINDVDNPQMILQLVPYYRRYQNVQLLINDQSGLNVLLATNSDTIIIACSGLSKGSFNGERDATYRCARTGWPVGIYREVCSTGGLHFAYQAHNIGVIDYIEYHGKTKNLCIAGVSLGGGLASLLISRINASFWEAPPQEMITKMQHAPLLYTFGMPAVLKIEESGIARFNCTAHHRVVQHGDCLPWIPFSEEYLEFLKALLYAFKAFHEAKKGNRDGAIRDLFEAVDSLELKAIYYRGWGALAKNVTDGTGDGLTMSPVCLPLQLSDVHSLLSEGLEGDYSALFEQVFAKCGARHNPRTYATRLYNELGDVFHHSLWFFNKFKARLKSSQTAVYSLHNALLAELHSEKAKNPFNYELVLKAERYLNSIMIDMATLTQNPEPYGVLNMPGSNGWNFNQELVRHFPLTA